MHFPNGVLRASLRSVTIGTWFQIRLENRFQHDLGCGLHHAVPNSRNPKRPLPASGLRDHYPPHRLWLIRLVAELLPDGGQPLPQPCQFNASEHLSPPPRGLGMCGCWRTSSGVRLAPPPTPADSIRPNVCPSTPGAPLLARASS